jgi:hypothetical protein
LDNAGKESMPLCGFVVKGKGEEDEMCQLKIGSSFIAVLRVSCSRFVFSCFGVFCSIRGIQPLVFFFEIFDRVL